jgi:hypothetical protein
MGISAAVRRSREAGGWRRYTCVRPHLAYPRIGVSCREHHHGLANPAAGLASPCFVLLTLGDGVWNRTFPERRGEFDCAPENLVPLKVTGDFGADPTPTPAPAPDDENVEDGG